MALCSKINSFSSFFLLPTLTHVTSIVTRLHAQELKRETAYRLGHTDAAANGNSGANLVGMGVGGVGGSASASDLQRLSKGNQPSPSAQNNFSGGSLQNRMPYPQPSFVYSDTPSQYVDSRNYINSQLGVGGGGGVVGSIPISSPPSGYTPSSLQASQHQFSTPRLPRHATVLKDRGSAENSVGSPETSRGVENMESNNYVSGEATSGIINTRTTQSSMSKVNRGSSQNLSKNCSAPAASSQPPKDMRSHEGRRTPVRDHLEVSATYVCL